jgi:hypothetical protein
MFPFIELAGKVNSFYGAKACHRASEVETIAEVQLWERKWTGSLFLIHTTGVLGCEKKGR